MDKQIVVHSYNVILLSNRMQQTTDKFNDMDDSQKHYAKQNKPDSKGYILFF